MIDIIVPTYNRYDDVKKFISEIKKQTFENYRVVIIDDHGDVNIKELVPNNDPRFVLHRLDANKGQAFARNYAVDRSSAEYLIFLDDDAWFLSETALEDFYKFVNKNPNDAWMFDVIEPNKKPLSERVKTKTGEPLGEFIACACAFNRKSFVEIGGFLPYFHSYGEETEMVIRMLLRRQEMVFLPEIKVFHNYNASGRSSVWQNRFLINSIRNEVYIIILHYPFVLIPFHLCGKYILRLVFIIMKSDKKINSIIQTTKGFYSGIFNSRFFFKERKALNFSQFRYWLSIRW